MNELAKFEILSLKAYLEFPVRKILETSV